MDNKERNSSAPYLYEALKACVSYLLGEMTQLDLAETIDLADKAMAKFEGRKSEVSHG